MNTAASRIEYVHEIHSQLGRKFTPEDVTPTLAQAAYDFLTEYKGSFDFLLDLRSRPHLSNAQIKGVLNCIIAQPVQKEATPHEAEASSIMDGTYTVVFPNDDYVTLRLKTPNTGNLAGKQIASYLYGPDNNNDFVGFAFTNPIKVWSKYTSSVREILALTTLLHADDPTLHGLAYALRSGNCYKCGRTLTVPASLHRGMGPICAKGGED